mgnify:CR=1 FL=1
MALGSAGALFLCPDAGEGGVIVKAYGKSWGYNVYDCRYCLYRKGKLDELAVLDGGKCILQLRGVRPFLSDKYDITRHPNYKYLSDANPRNAFDIEKYLSTRLVPKADEVYEVFDAGRV